MESSICWNVLQFKGSVLWVLNSINKILYTLVTVCICSCNDVWLSSLKERMNCTFPDTWHPCPPFVMAIAKQIAFFLLFMLLKHKWHQLPGYSQYFTVNAYNKSSLSFNNLTVFALIVFFIYLICDLFFWMHEIILI